MQSSSGNRAINLWDQAFQALPEHDKRAIAAAKLSTRTDVVDDVLRILEENKSICKKKQWRYTNSNGQAIVLRHVCDKIIKYVDAFKSIGDAIMSIDAAYAALPWAAIRLILMFVVANSVHFGPVAEGLETVTRLISRYTVFEALYLVQHSPEANLLREQLILMYARILRYLASARAYYGKNTLRRFFKGIAECPTLTCENNLQEVKDAEMEVDKCANLIDRQSLNQLTVHASKAISILYNLENPVMTFAATYEDNLDREKRSRILQWLSTVDYRAHYRELAKDLLPNSGRWLIGHNEYKAWRNSSNSCLLWLHGAAGCGKTMLMTNLINSDSAEIAGLGHSAIAYFYCGRDGVSGANYVQNVFGSLLKQIGSSGPDQELHEMIRLEYERKERDAALYGLSPERMELSQQLDMILHLLNQTPTILVIDALDEVDKESLLQILDGLAHLLTETTEVLKLVVSSRYNLDMYHWCENLQSTAPAGRVRTISIGSSDVQVDLEAFVKARVTHAKKSKRMLRGDVSDELESHICRTLIRQSDGMMLYASLQIQNLCSRSFRHEQDIRRGLENPPTELTELYKRMHNQVLSLTPFSQAVASRTFLWLTYARKPLSTSSLIAAVIIGVNDGDLSIKLDNQDVLDYCLQFVVLDRELDVFRFAHSSIADFIKENEVQSKRACNAQATSTCLAIYKGLTTGQPQGFREYAACYWQEHYHESQNAIEAMAAVRNFMFTEQGIASSFFAWLADVSEICKHIENLDPLRIPLEAVQSQSKSPLFTICMYGLTGLEEHFETLSFLSLNDRNQDGASPIYLAARSGSSNMTDFLISHGVDPNVRGGHFDTPLLAACFFGYIPIVRTLLRAGALWEGGKVFEHPLQAAIAGGHEALAIELVNDSAIEKVLNLDDAIEFAAYKGHKTTLESLWKLRQSRKDMSSDTGKVEALQAAVFGCHGTCSLTKIPLTSLNSIQGPFGTYLVAAALGGNNHMVTSLLDQGADIDLEGRFGTPLRAATIGGHETTVVLLLSRGADVNAGSLVGDALQAAALHGYTSIMTYLLDHGADPKGHKAFYGGPLHAAAFYGHVSAVGQLLDRGVKTYDLGRFGNALESAIASGHTAIAMLLLARCLPPIPVARAYGGRRDHQHDILLAEARRFAAFKDPDDKGSDSPVNDFNVNANRHSHIRSFVAPAAFDTLQDMLKTRKDPWDALKSAASIGDNEQILVITSRQSSIKQLSVDGSRFSPQEEYNKESLMRDAILEAAQNGHASTVQLLFQCAQESRRLLVAKAALEAASLPEHHRMAIDVLEKGTLSGYGERDQFMGFALRYAAEHGLLHLLDELVRLGATDSTATVRFDQSACSPPDGCLTLLGFPEGEFRKCPDWGLSRTSEKPGIYLACSGGHTAILQMLLQNFWQTYDSDIITCCFLKALRSSHVSVCKAILDYGHSLSEIHALISLRYAVLSCQSSAVDFILELFAGQLTPSDIREAYLLAAGASSSLVLSILESRFSRILMTPPLRLEALHFASFKHRTDIIEFLAQNGVDPTAPGNFFSNALHAAFSGFACTYIAVHGPNVAGRRQIFHRYSSYNTQIAGPLSHICKLYFFLLGVGRQDPCKDIAAATSKMTEILEYLLSFPFEPNRNIEGLGPPLNVAAFWGCSSATRHLLDKGANREEMVSLPVKNLLGRTNLFGPRDESLADNVSELLVSPLDQVLYVFYTTKFDRSFSFNEVFLDPIATAKILLQYGALLRLDHPGLPNLVQASVIAKDKAMLNLLFHKGVDPDIRGGVFNTALNTACFVRDRDLVQYLCEQGADPSLISRIDATSRNRLRNAEMFIDNSLQIAAAAADYELVKLLLEWQAHPSCCNTRRIEESSTYPYTGLEQTMLHLTAQKSLQKDDRWRVIDLLLRAGTRPDYRLLSVACQEDAPLDLIALILQLGANPNGQDLWNDGFESPGRLTKPIEQAARRHNFDLLQLLLNHGGDPSTENVLSLAVQSKKMKLVQLLLDAGANPNIKSDTWYLERNPMLQKMAPLTNACEACCPEIAEMLLMAGADVNADNGRPLQAAQENGAAKLELLLIAFGAKQGTSVPG